MAPVLYYMSEGSPSRGVLMTVKKLNLNDIQMKLTRTYMKEHLDPGYLRMNPMHTVPTLDDGGFYLIDSHTIAIYLVEQYGAKSTLLGSNLRERMMVFQRLFFDSTFMTRIRDLVAPILYDQMTYMDKHKMEMIYEMIGFLDIFLKETDFVAGKFVSIADFFILSNILTLMHLGFDFTKYKFVNNWFKKMRTMPGFDENDEGAVSVSKMVKSKMPK